MVALHGGATAIDGEAWVRCTQADPLGCNWLVPESEDPAARGRCLADSLIRREPEPDDTIAREKLAPTAVALRRLIYQLDWLGLPIDGYWRRDGGLAFDLLSSHSTGERITIGHADGVITIDLVESLDAYRETLRVRLGEPYRTMLGHFRHEAGHYYQNILVETGPGAQRYLARCRDLFGDERASYADALARHYEFGAPPDWRDSLHLGVRDHAPMGGLRRVLRPLPAHHRHHRHRPGGGHGAARRPGPVHRSAGHRSAGVVRRRPDRPVVVRLEVDVAVLQSGEHRNGKEPVVPFEIGKPVADKLGFVHEVVRESAGT